MKKCLACVSAPLAGLEIGVLRPGARAMAGKYFQHGERAKNTVFMEFKGGSIAIREQWGHSN